MSAMWWQKDLCFKLEEEAHCFHDSKMSFWSLHGRGLILFLWGSHAFFSLYYKHAFQQVISMFSSLDVQIIKYDILTKSSLRWGEEHCWPSESVFLATPDAKEEDDGKTQGREARPLYSACDHILRQKHHLGIVAPPTSHSWGRCALKPQSV